VIWEVRIIDGSRKPAFAGSIGVSGGKVVTFVGRNI